MSVPGKLGWLRMVNKPFAEPDSDVRQCRTRQIGECLPPTGAPGPGEIYKQKKTHTR